MSAPLGAGDLLDGKYRIIRVIGEGGWGVVYEGENARTLKRVAIKVLRARADLTPEIRTRFEREAQAGGRIGSEHIVEVFDLGSLSDGTHFLVMELLNGEDLATRLRNGGPLDPLVAAKIVIQLLDGLGAAHRAGILHRDLKPENLYLVPTRSGEDFVKILDFGVSKFSVPGMNATRTGAVLGSPFYMAPEQARGLKQIDGRTDLYSVGALLYECVTGRVPFDGENFNDLMFKIALAPRPNPLHLRPTLDHGMAGIIVKSIAADPNERFSSAEDFRATLVAWMEARGAGPVFTPELRQVARSSPMHVADSTGRLAARGRETGLAAALPSRPSGGGADRSSQTPLSSASPSVRRTSRKRALVAAAGTVAVLGVLGATARWRMGATSPESAPAALSPAEPRAVAPENAGAPREAPARRAVTAPPDVPAPERLPDPVETAAVVAPPPAVALSPSPAATLSPSPAAALSPTSAFAAMPVPVHPPAPPAAPLLAAPQSPSPAAAGVPPAAGPRPAGAVAWTAPKGVTADGAGFTTSLDAAKGSPDPAAAAPSPPPAAPKEARPFEKIEGREVRTGL